MQTNSNKRNRKATIVSPATAKAKSTAEANLAKFPLNFQMAIRLLAAVAVRNIERRRQGSTESVEMTSYQKA